MLETIWNTILPNILEIIWAIVSLVISCYLVPYLKNDFIPWLKEKRLYSVVKSFVQAAEKLAESGAIDKADKKKKVIEFLTSKGIKIDSTVEALIESCVKELDMVASVVYEEIIEEETTK